MAAQPQLNDLLARFLDKHANALQAGLAGFDANAEVTPFEAGPVQPIDPKLAWDETLTAVRAFSPELDAKSCQAPPHWPNLVASHEPVVALAFAAGNFPQLVRNFHVILHKANLTEMRPKAGRPVEAPALLAWADQVQAKAQFPQALLALGALRLAKQYVKAHDLAKALEAKVPANWQAAWANEKAALLWHQGQADEARSFWQSLAVSTPVLFNRGMADLFLGNTTAARKPLTDAVAQLPEASSWHHLGRLYLTLTNRI